jgi:hypothetical protein
MSNPAIGDGDVVGYLKAHSDFFTRHADLLATITVPHPHGGRTISLHERQLEVLREKNRALEAKLAELIRIGQENEAIADRLQKYTRQLLLTGEAERLPTVVAEGLRNIFSVPMVALRLWGVREPWRELPVAAPVEVDAITLANSMKTPYCGPNAEFQAAAWLPDGGVTARSIALMPLRKGVDPHAFGMLVLGSADPGRFQMNMGTAFLDRIAEITSAALARVIE